MCPFMAIAKRVSSAAVSIRNYDEGESTFRNTFLATRFGIWLLHQDIGSTEQCRSRFGFVVLPDSLQNVVDTKSARC